MSQTSVGAQSESDSGIEEPFETDRRNAEKTQTPRDVGGNDSTERQLELREKYDFAVARGFDQVKTIAAINPSEIISESTATSDDDGVSLRSYEGSGPLAVPDQTSVPVTLIKNYITDCSEFQTGPLTNVVNNVTVVVKDEASSSSQESIETGRKKLGVITTVVTGSVLLTLILVIIVVIVQIAHLRIDTTNVEPSCENLPLVFNARYVDRKNWFARTSQLQKFSSLPLLTVIIDSSGLESCNDHVLCPNAVLDMQARDVANGSLDINANFVLAEDGYIYEGRGWDYVGQNVPGHDSEALEITLMGSFASVFPKCFNLTLPLLLNLGVTRGTLAPNFKVLWKHEVYERSQRSVKPPSPAVVGWQNLGPRLESRIVLPDDPEVKPVIDSMIRNKCRMLKRLSRNADDARLGQRICSLGQQSLTVL